MIALRSARPHRFTLAIAPTAYLLLPQAGYAAPTQNSDFVQPPTTAL